MIRTTRMVTELKCERCGIIHLLGETFNGQQCCDKPISKIIGEREVPVYTKTNEEEKAEVVKDMQYDDISHFSKRMQDGGW